jgi:hypothetical protein
MVVHFYMYLYFALKVIAGIYLLISVLIPETPLHIIFLSAGYESTSSTKRFNYHNCVPTESNGSWSGP